MLPALAYTSEPLRVTTSGGTMTTFDGAGVTVGPPSPLPFPVPLVLREWDLALEQVERDERHDQQADDRQDGRHPVAGSTQGDRRTR